MRMSEAQINFTLEMLRTGVSSIMYNYERLNIVPTVAQFKKSFESYRISFGQTGWGIQPVPQMAANSIPPIAPPPYQSMPYMPQQMQGTYHPGYPQQPFFPSNGYVFPQQQPERVIRENMEYSNPKWNRSTPTPNFNKDSELDSTEAGLSSKDDDLDIEDDSAHKKKPTKRSIIKEPVDDGKEKDILPIDGADGHTPLVGMPLRRGDGGVHAARTAGLSGKQRGPIRGGARGIARCQGVCLRRFNRCAGHSALRGAAGSLRSQFVRSASDLRLALYLQRRAQSDHRFA